MRQWILSLLIFTACITGGFVYRSLNASDHDDGENTAKARQLNLTDHYVFSELSQEPGGSADKLVFVQNSSPRSLRGFQYHFSALARYELRIHRVVDKDAAPNQPSVDVALRFQFSAADATTNVQNLTMSYIKDGVTVGSATGTTTNYVNSVKSSITDNSITIGGHTFRVFAGMRQDPFFFDVVRFFQVRDVLIQRLVDLSPTPAFPAECGGTAFLAGGVFNDPICASDFTKNYNVNSIVVTAPIAALQSSAEERAFDTWSVITYPQ